MFQWINRKSALFRELEVLIVWAQYGDRYIATSVEFGLWDSARSKDDAVEGLLNAIRLLISGKGEAELAAFLLLQGLKQFDGVYRTPDKEITALYDEYVSNLERKPGDPTWGKPNHKYYCVKKLKPERGAKGSSDNLTLANLTTSVCTNNERTFQSEPTYRA